MLAKPAHALPDGEGWLFEPKWDGFRALVFRDADVSSERDGVHAEYAYIRLHFPGWKPERQTLLTVRGRSYDSIELTGPDGAQCTILFDITGWFGK